MFWGLCLLLSKNRLSNKLSDSVQSSQSASDEESFFHESQNILVGIEEKLHIFFSPIPILYGFFLHVRTTLKILYAFQKQAVE